MLGRLLGLGRRRDLGGQERGAGFGGQGGRAVGRRALDLEVEVDLVVRPRVTGSIGWSEPEFQWVRSRICWIVDLVVPTRRMICESFSSGWLRSSHRMALGRSWRRDSGV